jgi:hypothetical protein
LGNGVLSLGVEIGFNYENLAKYWLCNKKFGVINMVSSAVCWCLWKIRNLLCFEGAVWISERMVCQRLIPMLKCWRVLKPSLLSGCCHDVAGVSGCTIGKDLPSRVAGGVCYAGRAESGVAVPVPSTMM